MRNLSDPDFASFAVDGDHRDCTFTLVNGRPAPFPAAGTPQPLLPPHDFRPAWRTGLWECARCGTRTEVPDGCNLGCPGAAGDTDAPPRVLWPPETVAALNVSQHSAHYHPYTCGKCRAV